MTPLTYWSPAEEAKVGREYSLHKLFLSKLEEDEEDLDCYVCDCGERLDFGINSVQSAMCDGGCVWVCNDKWERINFELP